MSNLIMCLISGLIGGILSRFLFGQGFIEGPQGPCGPMGPIGKVGPQGPRGLRGPKGDSYILTKEDKKEIANLIMFKDQMKNHE